MSSLSTQELAQQRLADVTGIDESAVSHGQTTKSVYVYEAPVRIWHWINVAAITVLCLTGSLDVRFGEMAARLVERIGRHARHEVIDGAGHAAHLERPDAVIDVVSTFLDDLPAPA